MNELEVERDGLKEQALKLSQERDTLNGALTEAQGAAVSRAGELFEANNSCSSARRSRSNKSSISTSLPRSVAASASSRAARSSSWEFSSAWC